MKKTKEKPTVSVKVTFTEGYEERFTRAILKIYENRLRQKEERQQVAG